VHRVVEARGIVLICDEDRAHTDQLAWGLYELGYVVEVVRTYAEAFAIACAHDLDALIVAPFLRDGSALVLPAALGIRRPRSVVLVCRIGERVSPRVARRLGFDAQLAKIVDAQAIGRLFLGRRVARDHSAPPSVRGETSR
jgi:ActR/RegA family two-component response regulator